MIPRVSIYCVMQVECLGVAKKYLLVAFSHYLASTQPIEKFMTLFALQVTDGICNNQRSWREAIFGYCPCVMPEQYIPGKALFSISSQ